MLEINKKIMRPIFNMETSTKRQLLGKGQMAVDII